MPTEVLLLIIATRAWIGFLDVNLFCLELQQKAAVVRARQRVCHTGLFVFNFERICIEILLRLFCCLFPREPLVGVWVRMREYWYRAFRSLVRRFYYHRMLFHRLIATFHKTENVLWTVF
jgi:hypothetical protein